MSSGTNGTGTSGKAGDFMLVIELEWIMPSLWLQRNNFETTT